MPVTKTAKRALRSSKRKAQVNQIISSKLEIAIRVAKKSKKQADINSAISLTDRAKKKKLIHKNKAARMKSSLNKLAVNKESQKVSKAPKKVKSLTSKKKASKK